MNSRETENKTSYVSFRIGSENFAITIFKVLEIKQSEQLTKVPNVSDYIMGMLNFRGSIVPVIDMQKRFTVSSSEAKNKMIIVVDMLNNNKSVYFGLMVDQVTNVVELGNKDIRDVPEMGSNSHSEFVEGFAEMDNKFLMIMNLDRVLDF